MIPTIEHDGEIYYRIDPEAIDLEKMDQALKVTSVFAYQVRDHDEMDVVTQSGGVNETINRANGRDWIVYNIGNAQGDTLEERLKTADVKVIREDDFPKLYELKEPHDDDSDYSDYDRITQGDSHLHSAIYRYIGKPVYVAHVPFNFVMRAPWKHDQFIHAGGLVVYNPNTSDKKHRDIYGIQGAHHRKAGQFEKTYTKIGDGNVDVIEDVYKYVIAADRSPISGIQFNMADLQRAYDRINQQAGLEKYK